MKDDLYAFVFKAQLAQEAVDRALDLDSEDSKEIADRIAQKMPLELFDKELVASASKMASVYTAIAAFENSVRKFIQDRLLEEGWAEMVDHTCLRRNSKRCGTTQKGRGTNTVAWS